MTRSPRAHLLAALSLAAAIGLAPAHLRAQAQPILPPWPPVMDTVSLNLSAEDWVKTETARVSLIIDAAGNGVEAGVVREELLKAARAVADAEWRLIRLDRRHDEAGLERWQAEMEARLPENRLSGLTERARKASRPGLQVQVGQVAFDPTLAEMEGAKTRLREEIYRRVTEEVQRLETAFPDRDFRLASVDFMDFEQFPPHPVPMTMSREKMDSPHTMEMMVAPAGGPGVQEKLRLNARVVLSAFASQPAAAPRP